MMTRTNDRPAQPAADRPEDGRPRPLRGFSTPQLLVLGLASIAPLVILVAILAAGAGLATPEAMRELALAAGENPGMITFGALFLASPVQWITGRTQVRVRKYLGIVFSLLAFSNGLIFVIESGIGAVLGSPFLIAGSVAVLLATPLFLTSSRASQRLLGMGRWRLLHKLTYPLAVALLAHVILIGDIGLGAVLITLGFLARIPAIRRRLDRGRVRRRAPGPPT